MGFCQHRHQRGRSDELNIVILPDRLATKAHSTVPGGPSNKSVSPWAIQRQVASLADQIPQLSERRASGQRAKRTSFSGKAFHRRDTGRAVFALVGDLARPPVQMRLERRPALKPAPGDRVLLDVADSAFVLPFRARSIGSTGPRLEAPVPGEGMQPRVKPHLARHRVMVLDKSLRIIDQDFRRNAPEPQECALQPFEPVGLALPLRGPDMHPARIAKRPDKHMDPHPLAADPNTGIAEVDLHLMTGRRLEADCRPLLRL